MLLRGLFALQFGLQRDELLAVTNRNFGLPGGLQVAVFQRAGLLQAAQCVALQARNSGSGQAQQLLQVAFVFHRLQQPRG
ncbi:hypothetical protein D3C76_1652950 [compost metagenome]